MGVVALKLAEIVLLALSERIMGHGHGRLFQPFCPVKFRSRFAADPASIRKLLALPVTDRKGIGIVLLKEADWIVSGSIIPARTRATQVPPPTLEVLQPT